VLGAGLRVGRWDEPLGSGEADLAPARHAGLTDPGAVGKHHQGQHDVARLLVEGLDQLLHQLRQLHVTQAGGLGQDLGLGEVAEAHPDHWVAVDQAQLQRLAEGGQQQREHLPQIGQRNLGLARPHQVLVQHIGIHVGHGQVIQARLQVLGDGGAGASLAF